MHLLRRNIGCYLLPEVSTAPLHYSSPSVTLFQISTIQQAAGSYRTGKMALSDGVTLKYWAPFFGN